MAIPLLPLFGLVKTIASSWLKRRENKAAHKVRMSEMKLTLKENRLQAEIGADVDLDKINTENMANSWKDEFVLIMFSIPVIMCFIPTMDVYVRAGFDALSETPVWYQVIFTVMCLTIYGHRKLAKLFAGRFLGGVGSVDDERYPTGR